MRATYLLIHCPYGMWIPQPCILTTTFLSNKARLPNPFLWLNVFRSMALFRRISGFHVKLRWMRGKRQDFPFFLGLSSSSGEVATVGKMKTVGSPTCSSPPPSPSPFFSIASSIGSAGVNGELQLVANLGSLVISSVLVDVEFSSHIFQAAWWRGNIRCFFFVGGVEGVACGVMPPRNVHVDALRWVHLQ